MESSTVCPVCTLYLRPGITLKNHLSTHPKQKVIEALVKLTEVESQCDENNTVQELCQSNPNHPMNSIANSPWNGGNIPGSSQVSVSKLFWIFFKQMRIIFSIMKIVSNF